MADEADALPGELALPASAEDGNTAPDIELDADPANDEGEGNEPEDELEEYEWSDGKKYKGPKGIRDGVMWHADYTRKTQEVSKTREELAAERELVAQRTKASETELQHRATLQHVEQELKRFPEGYNWQSYQMHRQQDPIAADEAWNYHQHLRGMKGELSQQISQAEQERVNETNREIGERLNKTSEFARTLKGWTPETDAQVINFAKENGFSDEDLRKSLSPATYKMLWLARIGQQTLNAPKKPASQPTPPPPLETVGGKSSAPVRKSLGQMSMAEVAADFAKKKAAGVVK